MDEAFMNGDIAKAVLIAECGADIMVELFGKNILEKLKEEK